MSTQLSRLTDVPHFWRFWLSLHLHPIVWNWYIPLHVVKGWYMESLRRGRLISDDIYRDSFTTHIIEL